MAVFSKAESTGLHYESAHYLLVVQNKEQSKQGGRMPVATLSKRSAFRGQVPSIRPHVCSYAAAAATAAWCALCIVSYHTICESVSPSRTSSTPEQPSSPLSPLRCCLAPVYWRLASLYTHHHRCCCHCCCICCCFCNEATHVLDLAPLSAPTTMSLLGRPARATSPHYCCAPCAERGSLPPQSPARVRWTAQAARRSTWPSCKPFA